MRRRAEPNIARVVPARAYPERGRVRYAYPPAPLRRTAGLRTTIDDHLFKIIVGALVVGAVGFGAGVYIETRSLFAPGGAAATDHSLAHGGNSAIAKSGAFVTSVPESFGQRWPQTAMPVSPKVASKFAAKVAGKIAAKVATENANAVVAREWSLFQPARQAEQAAVPATKDATAANAPTKIQTPAKAPIHLASADGVPPRVAAPLPVSIPAASPPSAVAAVPSSAAVSAEAKTTLVDFETAPFPYHGTMPGSDRPFLNAGQEAHRGHVNFRGHVYWESETYSDDRVLLHIPPHFDINRPAVMVVFFHGHGAELARDVRDRQELPAQITAAGVNAVLVAPQFAFDAADSSAGKFWQPDAFKRFLDEAAQKLAKMYGDPRGVAAFANMPIVIVAYSGGFGPTLAVLDRGGANARIRGLVLLDALYAGFDSFADWIAKNRSAFFVSAYTTHTEGHNAELKHLLSERSVAYGADLKPYHLQGSVAFLPTGDISHRDFVNRAWTEYPVADILTRMNDVVAQIGTADRTASISPGAVASAKHN